MVIGRKQRLPEDRGLHADSSSTRLGSQRSDRGGEAAADETSPVHLRDRLPLAASLSLVLRPWAENSTDKSRSRRSTGRAAAEAAGLATALPPPGYLGKRERRSIELW